ncbi:ribosomal RNA-processing protein 14-C-like [Musa acuminata AAA Group]|uniref:ribosomal RNA-processing protein 14-C-like n=1 Tax=Musa acuminata AAA Group TaxID=214697 RepID=UPI0031E292A0
MKRKVGRQEMSSASVVAVGSSIDGGVDLKTLIHGHSLFFDRLVELIPARFYLPVDDDKPWFQGLSKAAKAAVKAESRDNLKEARRVRLDPAQSSTTLDLLKRSIEAEKSAADTSDDEEDDEGEEDEDEDEDEIGSESMTEVENPVPVISDNRSVTYEELRQRLHRRIEELRSGRNTRPLLIKNRPDKREKKKNRNKKKNKEEDASTSQGKRKRDENETREKGKKKKSEKAERHRGDAVAPDISFGQVKIGGEDEHRSKRRKLSKLQELERAKKLQDSKKDPEKGLMVSKKHSWKAAVSRAAGMKVHDDPKLLKESMKKEKKRQQKHAEKWEERIKNTENIRAEKQKTRAENIKERIKQKKMRRIEKREKKLMRPGFEGRKEGYINE